VFVSTKDFMTLAAGINTPMSFEDLDNLCSLLYKENQRLRDIVLKLKANQDNILWEPCDCGCPSGLRPRNKECMELIRMLEQ